MGEQLHLGIGDPSSAIFGIWDDLLARLARKIGKATFEGWLKDIRPVSLNDGVLLIGTPSQFARDWIEKRYANLLRSSFTEILGYDLELCFTVVEPPKKESGTKSTVKVKPVKKQEPEEIYQFLPLNEKYTFKTFVEGKSNRLAVAGAKAVARQPGTLYNPLFFYGGVGIGKTHLMQAIGNEVLRSNRGKIAYVTGEMFTTDYVAAIRERKVDEFRHKYRSIDVLLLDDIQFIAEKERTEEEFFHTFNALYQMEKQIVLCSDRAPKDLHAMDARLRSRFESGLVADIKAPELETRMAILQRKAEFEHITLPDDVILYMASIIKNNIRSLEGALIKLLAYSSLTESPVTERLAVEVLGKYFIDETPPKLTVEEIKKAVCKRLNIELKDLTAKKRSKEVVLARQLAMHLARELTDFSLEDLGEKFGRDHTTVLHACNRIKSLALSDADIASLIMDLRSRLTSTAMH